MISYYAHAPPLEGPNLQSTRALYTPHHTDRSAAHSNSNLGFNLNHSPCHSHRCDWRTWTFYTSSSPSPSSAPPLTPSCNGIPSWSWWTPSSPSPLPPHLSPFVTPPKFAYPFPPFPVSPQTYAYLWRGSRTISAWLFSSPAFIVGTVQWSQGSPPGTPSCPYWSCAVPFRTSFSTRVLACVDRRSTLATFDTGPPLVRYTPYTCFQLTWQRGHSCRWIPHLTLGHCLPASFYAHSLWGIVPWYPSSWG